MSIDRMVFTLIWHTDFTHKSEPLRSERGEVIGTKEATYKYPKSNEKELNILLKQGWRLESDDNQWMQTGESGAVVLKLYKEVE